MKKQFTRFGLGLFLLSASATFAQQGNVQPCDTYKAMEQVFNSDPSARARYEANQKQLLNEFRGSNSAQGKSAAAFEYTIPVVFHILHTNGPENIDDAQCLAAVAQVNSDLAKLGADANLVAPPFGNLYINSEIKLMMAKRDPNGNCTNGIVHRYDTRTVWDRSGDLNALYNGIIWDPTRYLNIIIVKEIVAQTGQSGIVVGYTYKPGTWPTGAIQDAIVYRYNYLNGLQARSLTHELGHWLNLNHTFGSTNNPGISCGDDGLYDTPPTKGALGGCPTSASGNACAALSTTVYAAGQDNIENIMGYWDCPKNFTTDQTNAMRSALASAVSGRSNLWQNANLTTNTNVNGTVSCAPIADHYTTNNSYTVCAGGTLTFKDASYNGVITGYQWTGSNGAVIASATSSLTNITFPTIGTSNITLAVSNAQGTSNKIRTVTVIDANPGIITPLRESFELGVPTDWMIINQNPGSSAWEQTSDPFCYHEFACMYIRGAGALGGQVDILETPIIDVANSANKTFEFAIAYAQQASTRLDVLKIQGSRDCGGTWTDIISFSANQMQLNTGGVTSGSFVPGSIFEWKTYTVSNYPGWNQFTNSSSVKVRFTFVAGGAVNETGNNIYIDAPSFFTSTDVGINELVNTYGYGVMPNPANGEAFINFKLNDASDVKVVVTDMLGKEILTAYEGNTRPGEHTISLNNNEKLIPGVYFVNLQVNGAKMSKKLVIN